MKEANAVATSFSLIYFSLCFEFFRNLIRAWWPYESASSLLSFPVQRAHSKFVPKRAVEIRDIAEAAIERDIQDLLAFRRETRCCVAQARSTHILMRRNSRQALERA